MNGEPSPNAATSSARRRTAVWLGYWVVLFVLTHVPVMRGVKLPQYSDKVIHFVVFFLLTILGGWRYGARTPVRVRGLLVWAVVYAAYAGLDEWLQQFVGRCASLDDFWANLVGVAAATVVLILFLRPPSGIGPAV